MDDRSLYLPDSRRVGASPVSIGSGDPRYACFDRTFQVSDMVKKCPGNAEAIRRHSPPHGPYAGDKYPQMFDEMTTKFDGTVLLEQNRTLKEKILLEYKTAKSSKGRQIDGNAHERLSFQVLQYLEISTRYTHCSLVVLANGAFSRYRNKYHVNFHVQADRLTNFAWFQMDHLCVEPEYLNLALRLSNRLLAGDDRASPRP